MTPKYILEYIRWKPNSPCKLWKFQSEPHNVELREDLWKVVGVMCKWKVVGVMCKTPERWEGWFANALLQITLPTSYELSFGSTSCGPDWSFHCSHEGVGFHLIPSQYICGLHRYLTSSATVSSMNFASISSCLVRISVEKDEIDQGKSKDFFWKIS
jgi:hypothetical protein